MIYFLDIEASSLEADSYPIEIAWVAESGQGESYLIRPEPDWIHWSADAERIHRIPREQLLSEGRHATWVAERAARVLAGANVLVVSDAPDADGRWLARLLALAEHHPVPVVNFYDVCRIELEPMLNPASKWSFRRAMREDALKREAVDLFEGVTAAEAMRSGTRHRALRDAEGLWWRWRELRERVAARVAKDGRG